MVLQSYTLLVHSNGLLANSKLLKNKTISIETPFLLSYFSYVLLSVGKH